MASISSPGLGSGLDVKSIVSQLVALERRPIDKLSREKSDTQARLSSFGLLQSYTGNLRDAAKKLALPGTWSQSSATSGNADAVAASATGSASPGAYSVSVSQLARAQSLASTSFANSSVTFGAGSLTVQLGQWTPGAPPGFTPKAGSASVPVPISAGDTLAAVRDRINDAAAGVKASIVNDGSGSRLVVRSEATGEENAVRIASAGDTSLQALAYSPDDVLAPGTMSETLSALDAQATINGLPVTSSSNTLTAAIDGVSLTLKQVTVTPVEVVAARDSQAMRKSVDDFVKAYNDLNTYITEQTKYDPEKKVAGKLQGDTATRSLQQQLRSMIQSTSGASAAFSSLSRAGVEIQRDGGLSVNTTRFNASLDSLASLSAAFTADAAGDANDGFGVRLTTLTTALTDGDGLLDRRSEGFRSQIKRQEAQIASLESRIARTEERLLKQYSTLDTNVGKLNSLGSYVNQQVTAWNNSKG